MVVMFSFVFIFETAFITKLNSYNLQDLFPVLYFMNLFAPFNPLLIIVANELFLTACHYVSAVIA